MKLKRRKEICEKGISTRHNLAVTYIHSNSLSSCARTAGITLVALVVTIVVLLILAGITINALLGKNSIFDLAREAGEKSNEQKAKERLEIVFSDLSIKKRTDDLYNEDKYMDDEFEKQNIVKLAENIVIVDGYQFLIDRSVPKIVETLGENAGKENEQINIVKAEEKTQILYEVGKVHVEIEYEGSLSEVIINGEKITDLNKDETGIYIIELEVENNGTYNIIAKDEEGNYKIATAEVTELTEDMEIWDKADMITFQEKVEEGRTFVKRTVRVMADINLEGSASEQWIPIGSDDRLFKGTFEGNNHVIDGIYIDKNEALLGLFARNDGTIQNLIIQNSYIKNVSTVAGGFAGTGIITGINSIGGKIQNIKVQNSRVEAYCRVGIICGANLSEIERCVNEGNEIKGNGGNQVGGIVGTNDPYEKHPIISKCYTTKSTIVNSSGTEVGGIVGSNFGIVEESFNQANVNSTNVTIGGIAGGNYNYIRNCYNIGTVKSTGGDTFGGIIGYMTRSEYTPTNVEKVKVENCYNVGTIDAGNLAKGGIVGYVGNISTAEIKNNYWLTGCGASYGNGSNNSNDDSTMKSSDGIKGLASILGDAFEPDEKNINNGYPVLKWQND